jgi:hypothetical protein
VLIATIKTVRYTRNCMIARFFVPLRNENAWDGPPVPRSLDRGAWNSGTSQSSPRFVTSCRADAAHCSADRCNPRA